MSSALDTFERSLVAASRTLAARAAAEASSIHDATDPPAARRRRPLRRLRSLSLAAQVVVALASLSVCTGVAVAGYALFAGGPARELPAFECQMNDRVQAIIPAITGSPLVDCAAQWPQASGGRDAAPPLAIWGADDGQQLVAVAAPVSAGPPPGDKGDHWRPLADSWTVDLPVVVLTDQLNNIDLPFNSGATSTCSYANDDIAAVRSLLHTDNLDSWHVTVQPQSGELRSGCHNVFLLTVDGQHQTVKLMQASPQPTTTPTTNSGTGASAPLTTATVTTGTAPTTTTVTGAPTLSESHAQALASGAQLAYDQLKQLYTTVNATLAAGCESVADAAALWTQAAQAAGFTPTTLAFWHAANDGQQPDPNTFFEHYTLYEQPASQNTGNCAHVLVMDVPGSGVANVYVARIAP